LRLFWQILIFENSIIHKPLERFAPIFLFQLWTFQNFEKFEQLKIKYLTCIIWMWCWISDK